MRVIQGAAQQDSGGCTVYVPLLNRLLPPDIRVLAATQVPPTFDARFDCLFRVYKYFFGTAGLDISRMRAAAKQFLGMHNFLRFCKVDRKQERSLWRRIIRFDLELQEDGFGVATIVGVSFLWHQVRYMMAALMEVGRGAWAAACISTLLREGLEVEAAVEAAKLDAAEESASMTRAGSTEVEELRLATESCCTALHPAPASNLVLYDCCFEGLYFSRTGAVNRLMLKPGDTEALHSPAKKLREAEADPQNSIAHPESAGKQNSAFEDEGICNTQTACNTNFGFGPRSTEESRTFQDEYMRSAHRMMVLRCLCEHSFPPW
uniref:tRNA pseudouridine synthase n=1 Tax=Eimeria tenella TaxID=5802 RepID=H9B9P6_EIMTE|nr:hypothetical protein [Eimeria tenella]